MVVSFRIDPVSLDGLDAQLWTLGPVRVVRRDGRRYLECDDADLAPLAICALARAGARAIADPMRASSPPPGAIAGIAGHLDRIDVDGIVDVVSVRPLLPGEATTRLVRRDALGRRRRDVDAIRAVLRESERAFLWRRVVWSAPRLLRSRALGAVRPVVFDRAAPQRPEGTLGFASGDALTRWVR